MHHMAYNMSAQSTKKGNPRDGVTITSKRQTDYAWLIVRYKGGVEHGRSYSDCKFLDDPSSINPTAHCQPQAHSLLAAIKHVF
jgi:hypothetical protein